MTEKIIYAPKKLKPLKRDPFVLTKISFKILGICARLLARSFKEKLTIKMVDEYLKEFWQVHFKETSTSLLSVGEENFHAGQTYVFMSNHESWYDIPAIYGAILEKKISLRMIFKDSLTKVPLLGKALLEAGFIPINRKNTAQAIKQLDKAKEILQKNVCIWIAPEGTRTRSEGIGSFKKGGFYLALELGVPIVPVFIEGAKEVLAPESMTVNNNQKIRVHFLPPHPTKNLTKKDIPHLVNKVRQDIINKKLGLKNEPTK